VKTPTIHVGELALNDSGAFKIGPFGSSLKKTELVKSGIPVAGIENVLPNNFVKGFRRFITARKFEELSDYEILPDDVLVTTMGTIGRAASAPRDVGRVIIDSHLFRMRVDTTRVFPPYLCYALNSDMVAYQLVRMARGAIMEGLNTKILRECSIPLPEMSEQQRIAGRLEQADRLVRTRRYALELTDTFLPAAFLELFGDPLALMRRWDRKPFGELLADELRNGLSPSTAGTITARVLTLSAITRGIFDSSSSKLAPFVAEPPNEKRVCSMDFLICRGNGNLGMVGRARFPAHDAPDCVFPDTMIAARVKPEMICKQFLEAVWESPALRKQIEASARTTNGTYKINQGVIEEMEIPLPPLPLQQRFAVLVEGVEPLRALQREALRQAEHLFASLLDRAFSG
jgi:type I restriction enzyme S subunit